MNHISEQQLALYAGADLTDDEASTIEQHLEGCPECQGALNELERSRDLLAHSLVEPAAQDLFEVRTSVLAKLNQRRTSQKPWKWPVAAALAGTAVILPLRFMQKPPTSPPQSGPPTSTPLLAANRPIPSLPLPTSQAKRSSRRRTVSSAGIRSATLLTRAGQPASLRISTSDPNVLILWQFNEKTQNP